MAIMKYSKLVFCILTLSSGSLLADKKESRPNNPRPSKSQESIQSPEDLVLLIRIEGTFDGSGRFSFSETGARYFHMNWERPSRVLIDGELWEDLEETPESIKKAIGGLVLRDARIVKRSGRDVVALERTLDGFDLYIVDSPNGASQYSVVIAIPRKQGSRLKIDT